MIGTGESYFGVGLGWGPGRGEPGTSASAVRINKGTRQLQSK